MKNRGKCKSRPASPPFFSPAKIRPSEKGGVNYLDTPERFCAAIYGDEWVEQKEEKFHHSSHVWEKQIRFLFAL